MKRRQRAGASKEATTVERTRAARPPSPPAVRVGRLLAGGTPGEPLVDFAGNRRGPRRGRAAVRLDQKPLERAVATGRGAVLLFEDDDPARPLVMGLLAESAGGALLAGLLVRQPVTAVEAPPAPAATVASPVTPSRSGRP